MVQGPDEMVLFLFFEVRVRLHHILEFLGVGIIQTIRRQELGYSAVVTYAEIERSSCGLPALRDFLTQRVVRTPALESSATASVAISSIFSHVTQVTSPSHPGHPGYPPINQQSPRSVR